MPFRGIIQPEILDLLASLRDAYCTVNNISEERAREEVGVRVITLFKGGALTTAELRAALGRLGQ